MTQQADLDLLQDILAGDEHAWRELLRRFRSLIYRCITKVTSRVSMAMCEDDLDEIFAELCLNLLRDDMKKLRAYDPSRGTKLSTWIGMLAVNTTYDHLRRRSRFPRLGQDDSPEPASCEPSPLDCLLALERRRALGTLVRHLSSRDRRFVSLYYDQGLEPEQIAEIMSISVVTVYTKKHKIRAKLVSLVAQGNQQAA